MNDYQMYQDFKAGFHTEAGNDLRQLDFNELRVSLQTIRLYIARSPHDWWSIGRSWAAWGFALPSRTEFFNAV